MTPTTAEGSGDRRIDDAVRRLEPPALAGDTLSRIIARRDNGERIALPLAGSDRQRSRPRELWISGALVTAAVVVIAVIGVERNAGSSPGVVTSNVTSLASADSVCGSYQGASDASAVRQLMAPNLSASPLRVAPNWFPHLQSRLTDRRSFPRRSSTVRVPSPTAIVPSEHAPSTYSISRRTWRGVPALLAVRNGPLDHACVTRFTHGDEQISFAAHRPAWYFTQKPVVSMHADFDSAA